MLKLKLQYFGHLMRRTDSLEKTLMLIAAEGGIRGWDGWMASPTRWTWVWASSGSWWWTGKPGVLQSTGWQRAGHDWVIELNWKQNCLPTPTYILYVTELLRKYFPLDSKSKQHHHCKYDRFSSVWNYSVCSYLNLGWQPRSSSKISKNDNPIFKQDVKAYI